MAGVHELLEEKLEEDTDSASLLDKSKSVVTALKRAMFDLENLAESMFDPRSIEIA